MNRQHSALAATLTLCTLAVLALPAAAQRLAINPVLPTYGQPVTVELQEMPEPVFMPATRYSRSGSTIYVDYEYIYDGFGPSPGFGGSRLDLGELPPGNYTVPARLHDIANPLGAPKSLVTNIAVVPPQEWGIYSVPVAPKAFSPSAATIRSAVYFDPASMRTSIAGSVIRVDFNYRDDAPAGGATPPGMTTYGSVAIPPLQPGMYRLEGWGTKVSGGAAQRYFTRDVMVASAAPVVEYYSASLDHYFMSASPDEIAQVDAGAAGDWKRTGQQLSAWLRPSDAPPGAAPVCRFYARGPNSHFYTGSAQECADLKAIEQQQRQQAAANGQPFLGWAYETIAFYAVLPSAGQCPAGMKAVYRAYNNRAAQGDSNHRFLTDPGQRTAMMSTWADEGMQLCSA